MATPETQVEKRRYLREPKVVFVRQIDDDHFLVTDIEDKNEYTISKEVRDREYVILY